MARKGKHGGTRAGSGRKLGVPQPHLRDPDARVNRINVSISDAEWWKLDVESNRKGIPFATVFYDYAKRGGL